MSIQNIFPKLIDEKINFYHQQNFLLEKANHYLQRWNATTPELEFYQTYQIKYQDSRFISRQFSFTRLHQYCDISNGLLVSWP